MNCDDADLLLAANAVDSLEPAEVPELRSHLRECARCRTAGTGYAETAEMLYLGVDMETPSPALRSRILAQVYGEAAALPPARVADAWYRRLWRAIPTTRGLAGFGGLATAAAAALAVWSFGVQHGPGPQPPVAITRSCGLTADPGAQCTLTYLPGAHQAVLSARDLPPLTSGATGSPSTYEVWLIRPDGAPVAAAFLSPAPDGRGWSAALSADLSGYSTVAATREPAGGSPGPTGDEVLRLALSS